MNTHKSKAKVARRWLAARALREANHFLPPSRCAKYTHQLFVVRPRLCTWQPFPKRIRQQCCDDDIQNGLGNNAAMAVSGTPKTSNPYTDIAPRGPAQNGLGTVAGAAPREPPSTASSKTDPDYDQDFGTDACSKRANHSPATAKKADPTTTAAPASASQHPPTHPSALNRLRSPRPSRSLLFISGHLCATRARPLRPPQNWLLCSNSKLFYPLATSIMPWSTLINFNGIFIRPSTSMRHEFNNLAVFQKNVPDPKLRRGNVGWHEPHL